MNTNQGYFKNKRVLVTGGLGFIGSSVAVKLLELGAKVSVLDGFLETHGANLFNIYPFENQIDLHGADLRDKHTIDHLVKEKDIVIHIAAHSSNYESIKNPSFTIDSNCFGTLVLLESARRLNPKVKFIFCASCAQYGIVKKLPAREETPMNPLSFYGVSKLVTEHYSRLYQAICGLRVVILRLTNTYGPRHQMKNKYYSVYNWLLRQIIDEEEVQIFGRGIQKRDLLFIDDAVNAFLIAASNEKAIGKIYNVSTGKGVKIVDFVKTAIKVSGSGSYKHIPFPDEWKGFERGDFYSSPELIENGLGWKPEISLPEGIRRTVEYYRKYKKYYW